MSCYDFKNKNLETVVQIACRNGDLRLVKALVRSGADISKPDAEGMNMLHRACQSENLAMVQFLLAQDAINESHIKQQCCLGVSPYHMSIWAAERNMKTIQCTFDLYLAEPKKYKEDLKTAFSSKKKKKENASTSETE